MSDFRNGYSIPATADMSADAGLRSFMLGVYNKLALGLVGGCEQRFEQVPQAPLAGLVAQFAIDIVLQDPAAMLT